MLCARLCALVPRTDLMPMHNFAEGWFITQTVRLAAPSSTSETRYRHHIYSEVEVCSVGRWARPHIKRHQPGIEQADGGIFFSSSRRSDVNLEPLVRYVAFSLSYPPSFFWLGCRAVLNLGFLQLSPLLVPVRCLISCAGWSPKSGQVQYGPRA